MRVTHVITRLIVGGAQENTVASVLGLNRLPGIEAHLISGPTTGPEGSLEPLFADRPDLLTILPSLVRPVRPALDVRAWLSLTRQFRRLQPDIVHTHSGKAGIVGRLAARTAGVPLVVHTIHGPSFGPFQGSTANTLFRTAERIAGKLTTHFVVVAHAMARQYRTAGIGRPDQFTRIVSGFDLDPFLRAGAQPNPDLRARLGLAPDDFVIGKIARLFDNKGHEDLVAVAPDLVRDLPHARFLFVGDGDNRKALEHELLRRHLSPHFIFAGLVPPSEVAQYAGIMDLLVHLSLREGLARALPQALAAGRPVVAYDCDGANEICINGRTGYLVPPRNLTALRERIRLLARDPSLRTQFGNQGRDLVRDLFPVERMIDELRGLYQRLIQGHPPRRTPSPFSSHPLAKRDPQ
ncbi:MAG: glycosyltransferase family 4 protein [Limisphaerales bacterium]